nr:MAG TPA: hypothetical protein [Caudoviricetes sp.]
MLSDFNNIKPNHKIKYKIAHKNVDFLRKSLIFTCF